MSYRALVGVTIDRPGDGDEIVHDRFEAGEIVVADKVAIETLLEMGAIKEVAEKGAEKPKRGAK